MAAQPYNPYVFTLPKGVTLFISAQFAQNYEVGLYMADLTVIDLGLEGRQTDFPPCLPVKNQGPGFIWGADSCSPSCPPFQFHYNNPDAFDHQISLSAAYKEFVCSDGNRFLPTANWLDCSARLVTSSSANSVTIGYKTIFNDPQESSVLLVLDDASVGMPIHRKVPSPVQAHGSSYQFMNDEQRRGLREYLLSLLHPE
jgi:hypothetical protein